MADDEDPTEVEQGGGEVEPAEVVIFDPEEGEVFTPDDPPDEVLDLPPFDPTAPIPRDDEPAIIPDRPADRAREKYGDIDEDAIHELLNTPELTTDDRYALEDLLEEFRRQQDPIVRVIDPKGEKDPEPEPEPEPEPPAP
ncbi:hypothetical protein [Streptomyces sp. NPDC002078]